ncbi:sigma-70 family RNA polymerase sigma factor [Allosphingosinicella indica]|uniref:RNA polymerase sigma-70 factor, ECF subfamily n=1 Tax=Allosphingosinicella indica TaxID=941907 RepID=A0A1X7FY84_9SPHN|nr:sigma-70 family RNA polymerase sigma factor [Allosphingosinicella indica]SMF60961.1 RNA polymerase sigma-70 factor, ECF subfamily [Allosphingosinicella indica]
MAHDDEEIAFWLALEGDDEMGGADHTLPIANLYRAHAARMLAFFGRRASRHEAGDLLHDLFARLAGRRQSSEVENPPAYMSRAAANLLRERARAATARASKAHLLVEEQATTHDYHQQLEQRDRLRRVEKALLALKPRSRHIFLAHRVHGLSYAEIAERAGVSERRVEKIMGKAIADLDRLMERD